MSSICITPFNSYAPERLMQLHRLITTLTQTNTLDLSSRILKEPRWG